MAAALPTGTLLSLGGGWDRAHIPSPQNLTEPNVFGLVDPIVPTSYDVADVALVTPTLCNYQKSATLGSGSNLWNVADWYVAPSCPS